MIGEVKFFTQPHRLFFFLAMVSGFLGMVLAIVLWVGDGQRAISPLVFHPFVMVFLFFPALFFGFLLTIFPRFLGMNEVVARDFIPPFVVMSGAIVVTLISVFIHPLVLSVGAILLSLSYGMILRILWGIHRRSPLFDKEDTAALLVALGWGLVTLSIATLGTFFQTQEGQILTHQAILAAVYFFLLPTFFVVNQRMIPFFSTSVAGYTIPRYEKKTAIFFLGSWIKGVTVVMGWSAYGWIGDAIMLGIFLSLLEAWRLPWRKAYPILTILYIGMGWLVIALSVGILESFAIMRGVVIEGSFGAASLHLLVGGYFATMAVGFGSRVLKGHGGETIAADRVTLIVFGALQLAIVLRVISGVLLPFAPQGYEHGILTAGLLWSVAFILWMGRYRRLIF